MSLIPVILCGGAGSRLWPVSRDLHPKPFIRLGDGHSLFQQAWLRALRLPGTREIFTVTNRKFLRRIEDEVQEVGAPGRCIHILEPAGRGTAAAIAAAALLAVSRDPDAVILVLAADHVIARHDQFSDAVRVARELAEGGKIVTFGIRPGYPETGYGYIEAEGHMVRRFVEKPDAPTAQAFVDSGRFYWNSGMICCRAAVMIEEMSAHCPDILAAVRACLAASASQAVAGRTRHDLEPESFAAVQANSIDCAVLEKSSRVAVVPCDPGWSDVGSWDSLGKQLRQDANGNRIEGDAVLHDVSNCHIWSSGRVVGAVGVENLVIVDTQDALLIADRDRSQDVRHLFSKLKASGHASSEAHPASHWGAGDLLEKGEDFDVRRLTIAAGGEMTLPPQTAWEGCLVTVRGTGNAHFGGRRHALVKGAPLHIPAGSRCRLSNAGDRELLVIHVLADRNESGEESGSVPMKSFRKQKVLT